MRVLITSKVARFDLKFYGKFSIISGFSGVKKH